MIFGMMMNVHAYLGGTMKTSVILHGLHNEFSLDQMKACISLAEKYGGSFRHVVTGIQITGIEKDDKEQLISELPEGVTTVIHRGVNSLIACVPMIVLYILFQKQFIEGIATSGGKL